MCLLTGQNKLDFDKDEKVDMTYYHDPNKLFDKGFCYRCCYKPWLQTPKQIFYCSQSDEKRIIFPYNMELGEFEKKPLGTAIAMPVLETDFAEITTGLKTTEDFTGKTICRKGCFHNFFTWFIPPLTTAICCAIEPCRIMSGMNDQNNREKRIQAFLVQFNIRKNMKAKGWKWIAGRKGAWIEQAKDIEQPLPTIIENRIIENRIEDTGQVSNEEPEKILNNEVEQNLNNGVEQNLNRGVEQNLNNGVALNKETEKGNLQNNANPPIPKPNPNAGPYNQYVFSQEFTRRMQNG